EVIKRKAIELGEVTDCNFAGFATMVVVDEPAQNLAQPGSDPLGVAQCWESSERLYVRLLHEVLGILGGPLEPDGQPIEVAEVRQRQRLESSLRLWVSTCLSVLPPRLMEPSTYRDGITQSQNSQPIESRPSVTTKSDLRVPTVGSQALPHRVVSG